MKNFALGSLLLSLGMFLTGCNDTAKQKDKSEHTVKTDQDTGETTIKEEERHTSKDDETGANVDTSVEKETTIKPADEDGDSAIPADSDSAAPADSDSAAPADSDNPVRPNRDAVDRDADNQ